MGSVWRLTEKCSTSRWTRMSANGSNWKVAVATTVAFAAIGAWLYLVRSALPQILGSPFDAFQRAPDDREYNQKKEQEERSKRWELREAQRDRKGDILLFRVRNIPRIS